MMKSRFRRTAKQKGGLITVIGIAISALVALVGSPARAATNYETILLSVSEICITKSKNATDVAQNLSLDGWEQDQTKTGVQRAMFSFFWARDYNPESAETLKYAVQNAGFMAASTLGNSSLPRNQNSYLHSGVRLTPLLGEGKLLYCILNAGEAPEFTKLLSNRFALVPGSFPAFFPDPAKTAMKGRKDNHDLFFVNIDIDRVFAAYSEFGIPLKKDAKQLLYPVTLYIVPSQVINEAQK